MTDTIHPLIIERFETGGLEDEDRLIIDWSMDLRKVEFYSPDLNDDQLQILRSWLELFISPERYTYGEFYFDGEDATATTTTWTLRTTNNESTARHQPNHVRCIL